MNILHRRQIKVSRCIDRFGVCFLSCWIFLSKFHSSKRECCANCACIIAFRHWQTSHTISPLNQHYQHFVDVYIVESLCYMTRMGFSYDYLANYGQDDQLGDRYVAWKGLQRIHVRHVGYNIGHYRWINIVGEISYLGQIRLNGWKVIGEDGFGIS